MFFINKEKLNKIGHSKIVKVYALSFGIPALLMLLVFILKSIFPFGERSFLRTDLYHQYVPFYSELLYKLHNFKSLFYTFHIGLGINFISLIAYYLSSPFNVLLFFVDESFIIEFVSYIVIVKIALCGFTMSYYLVKKFKSVNYYVVMISIFYAMSGYIAAYSWNVMWLDCILLFPLLMLGIEKLYYNGKPYLYIVTLALSILTNYYISIMICIFLIIYFIFLVIISNDKKIKTILKKLFMFIISSLIAGGISAILLFPTICAFFYTGSNKMDFPKNFYEYFPIVDILSRHLPFIKIENGLEHWPNIYCGIMVFPLLSLYYFNKKYTFKEKIAYTILILFLISSFSINIFAFFWHGLRFPNSLPARQSFIYVFLILVLCYRGLNKFKNVLKNDFFHSFVISIVLVIILDKIVSNEKTEYYVFYYSLVFLFLYFVLLYIHKNKVKTSNRLVLLTLALTLLSTEAFFNMYFTSVTTIKRDSYIYKYDDIKKLNKQLDDYTNDFYRVEMNKRLTKDDGAFYNYPSASIFSSQAYKEGTDFYKKFGMEASMNAYSITGSTPFADSLLSVNYEYFDNKIDNPALLNMRLIQNTENVYLYQHLDILPLSFVLTNEFLEKYDYSSGNPATVQNNFARALHSDILLEKIDVNIDGTKASFVPTEDGDYYLFVRDKSIEKIVVQFPTTAKTYDHIDRGFFAELSLLKANESIEVRNDTNDKELLIEVFKFNYKSLKKLNDKILQNADFEIISFDETHIDYNLDVKNAGVCMLSLPFDKSFTLYVDGKKTEIKKMFDCFLSFDINKGQHNIHLVYMPQGFITGSFVSALSIICLIVLYLYQHKIQFNNKNKRQNKIKDKILL